MGLFSLFGKSVEPATKKNAANAKKASPTAAIKKNAAKAGKKSVIDLPVNILFCRHRCTTYKNFVV